MSKERWSRSGERPGTDRGRRVGRRIEPSGTGGRGSARRGRRRRSSSCSPTGRVRRWTGRPSRGSRPRSSRAATMRRWPRRCRRSGRTSSCSPGYMRIVGPAVLAAFAGPDPQHASVAPARVPGRARRGGRPRARRDGDRLHRPPRRRDARRRPDRRPGSGRGDARRRRGTPARADPRGRASAAAAGRGARCSPAPSPSSRMGGESRSTPPSPTRPSRRHDGRCSRCRTRPGSGRSRRGWSRPGSSSSRPGARPGRFARPACPSPTSPP